MMKIPQFPIFGTRVIYVFYSIYIISMNGLIDCYCSARSRSAPETGVMIRYHWLLSPGIIAVTKYNPAERNHYAKVKGDSTVNHRPYLSTTMDLKCFYSLGDCPSPLPSPRDESPGWGWVGASRSLV